jgi:hypothetical protein
VDKADQSPPSSAAITPHMVPLVQHRENFILPYPGTGIATGYGLYSGGVGVRGPVGARFLSNHRHPDRFWDPPGPFYIQWLRGALPSGIKQPGRETDHSLPTSAEVKNTWIYTSTTLYVFMAYT